MRVHLSKTGKKFELLKISSYSARELLEQNRRKNVSYV